MADKAAAQEPKATTKTRPAREQSFIDYWVKKREKAITERDQAEAVIKGADAILLAAGWPE